ncbi:unnamed protein product [Penicillium roqueforti FM164]|uniref:Genomic scaffold, ProqFM164S02 n=1 Tax=Penicillium roqueforti (strain FM164) TaxID=1365484 RepID=W6Q8Q7_PENRF|nr:unnamed protein product [Penicillium roqueforti FM164]
MIVGWDIRHLYHDCARKYRCFVLFNGKGALPSPLAILLVQIRVQGEDIYRVVYALDITETSYPTAFYRQQSKLNCINPGTMPRKVTTGGSDVVLDIDI